MKSVFSDNSGCPFFSRPPKSDSPVARTEFLKLDGKIIHAGAHLRQPDELVAAMKQAASNVHQRIRAGENNLVVGVQSQYTAMVFVNEDVSNIRLQVFAEVIAWMWGMVQMGLIAAAVVN